MKLLMHLLARNSPRLARHLLLRRRKKVTKKATQGSVRPERAAPAVLSLGLIFAISIATCSGVVRAQGTAPAPMPAEEAQSSNTLPAASVPSQPKRLDITPEQLVKRLVQMAEGPVVTRAELEKAFEFEFNIHYVRSWGESWTGIAPLPFKQDENHNVAYSESSAAGPSFALFFARTNPRVCIPADVFKRLMSPRWERYVRDMGGHYSVITTYVANFNGIARRLTTTPAISPSADCFTYLSVQFFTNSSAPLFYLGDKK